MRFRVDLGTPAGLEMYRFGVSDPSARHFVRALKPGWHVIDGGANIGVFTLLAAQKIGETGELRAVEASAETADLLEANVRLNNFANVTIVRAALTDTVGESEFSSFGPGAGVSALRPATSSGNRTIVATTTIEALVESFPNRRVDAIKLDLEGAEFLALSQWASLLHEQRPILM
ncbi:MAG: FkbM family methyltransferase, partial [Actinomycetota bacterium]|nr:FkbM family methyltransferase [Actinomycetota bacterium]